MYNSGLVLEGGGMRGVYTAGVLEYFLEKELFFPYIIGVSAGACNAASYLSRQAGRNRQVTIDYVRHRDYLSLRNLVVKKQLFGMDFIFNTIPNELVPFDFQTFENSPETFVVGTTDCLTGEAVYFEKKQFPGEILQIIRASSTLPFMAPAIEFHGSTLMDGGIADPIPIKKAELDQVQKKIVVLTKPKGYRKRKSSFSWIPKYAYKEFPGLTTALEKRYQIYNETLDYIETLEDRKEVIVLRPSTFFITGSVERDPARLTRLYQQGYDDAGNMYEEIISWLGERPTTALH